MNEEFSGEIENCSVKAEDRDSGANRDVTYTVTNSKVVQTSSFTGTLKTTFYTHQFK